MTYIAPAFMTHAAPEAIEAAIREAEVTRDRYAKKASVLRGLLATRHDQIAAGTWPGTPTESQPAAEPQAAARQPCTECGLAYQVKRDGTLRLHNGVTLSGFSTGKPCPGANKPPAPGANKPPAPAA